MRVKTGFTRRRRHKKIIKLNKGYRGMRQGSFKKANEAMMKAGRNAYRDRRLKKRDFRGLWITRLSAAVREQGISYSVFIAGLKKSKIALDRKALSELAIHEPKVFAAIMKEAGVGK